MTEPAAEFLPLLKDGRLAAAAMATPDGIALHTFNKHGEVAASIEVPDQDGSPKLAVFEKSKLRTTAIDNSICLFDEDGKMSFMVSIPEATKNEIGGNGDGRDT